jgi:rod shape-determining protein MreD
MLNVLLFLIFFVAGIFQLSIAPRMSFMGGYLMPVLDLVVAWTLIRGFEHGIKVAIFAGILLDLLSFTPIGMYTICFTIVALVAGGLRNTFFADNPILAAAAVIVCSLVFYIVAILVLGVVGFAYPSLTKVLLIGFAISIAMNTVIMPALYYLLMWMDSMFPLPVEPEW